MGQAPVVSGWAAVEQVLDSIEQGVLKVEPADPLADQLLRALNEHVNILPPEQVERSALRIMRAFSLNAKDVAEQLGSVTIKTLQTNFVRPPFMPLIPAGWVRNYLNWCAESEAAAQLHFGAIMAAVSAALGRKPLFDWRAKRMFANLYVLLVGPSGAKKSSAIDMALGFTQKALPTINVLPYEGTPQGYAESLRKRCEETGTADGLIACDELGVLMSRDRNKEDMAKWMTAWYDSPDTWERGLVGRPGFVLENVCVTVLAGSTPEWLRGMPADAIVGGFLPRFIVLDAVDRRHFKADPQFDTYVEAKLQQDLRARVLACPPRIGFTLQAKAWLRQWYEVELRAQIERTVDEGLRKWLDRKQAAVMKLAFVWQLLDGGPMGAVEERWLKCARAVVDWGDTSVNAVYSRLREQGEGEVAADLLRWMERAGGVASHDQLIRGLRVRYGIRRIREALATLQASGEIAPAGGPLRNAVWVLKK